jgi:predicted AAA+ superfamily ATPase
MYRERILTQSLKKLAKTFPVVVVVGARQVGKSTLIQHTFKAAEIVVFDPVVDVENARHDPELFLNNHRTPLILDEIQYAPDLVSTIKRRIDKNRTPGQYIMSGSQQWSVLKSMAESLAGRAVFLDLEGFCLAETADAIIKKNWFASWLENPSKAFTTHYQTLPYSGTLYEQLWRGWLPEAQFIPLENIPDFHGAYLRTYIERDARLLADVSDWQLFGRFVRLAAALTAQEVNYNQLGRELGLNPQTAKRWLDILVATFQWYEIPAYWPNAIKRISSKPKGYIGDTGVACFAQAISTPRAIAGHPLWGALFETAVVSEIRKLCGLLSPKPNFYHWRTHAGAEVDIILERDGILFPIEIKAKSSVNRWDCSGLTAFRKSYPKLRIEKGLILAPTEKVLQLSETDYVAPWNLR